VEFQFQCGRINHLQFQLSRSDRRPNWYPCLVAEEQSILLAVEKQ